MAGDTIITIVGNLTADPEMRFTPSGAAVAPSRAATTAVAASARASPGTTPLPAAPRTTRGPRAAPPPSVTSPRSEP